MAKDKKEVYLLNKVNGQVVYETFSQATIKTVENPATAYCDFPSEFKNFSNRVK